MMPARKLNPQTPAVFPGWTRRTALEPADHAFGFVVGVGVTCALHAAALALGGGPLHPVVAVAAYGAASGVGLVVSRGARHAAKLARMERARSEASDLYDFPALGPVQAERLSESWGQAFPAGAALGESHDRVENHTGAPVKYICRLRLQGWRSWALAFTSPRAAETLVSVWWSKHHFDPQVENRPLFEGALADLPIVGATAEGPDQRGLCGLPRLARRLVVEVEVPAHTAVSLVGLVTRDPGEAEEPEWECEQAYDEAAHAFRRRFQKTRKALAAARRTLAASTVETRAVALDRAVTAEADAERWAKAKKPQPGEGDFIEFREGIWVTEGSRAPIHPEVVHMCALMFRTSPLPSGTEVLLDRSSFRTDPGGDMRYAKRSIDLREGGWRLWALAITNPCNADLTYRVNAGVPDARAVVAEGWVDRMPIKGDHTNIGNGLVMQDLMPPYPRCAEVILHMPPDAFARVSAFLIRPARADAAEPWGPAADVGGQDADAS